MARSRDHRTEDLRAVRRTRAGRIWVAITPALVFLVLLIVFIAENGQTVKVSFFGATAHPPLAIALLIAAVAGAIVVLLAGSVRILQLRRAAHRHVAGAGRSAAAAGHETKAVETQGDADTARP